MGNGIRVKHKHIWYNPNKKKTVSGKKYENAISHYNKLMKRIEIEGETKWLKNAIEKVRIKFKKYGITDEMIQSR